MNIGQYAQEQGQKHRDMLKRHAQERNDQVRCESVVGFLPAFADIERIHPHTAYADVCIRLQVNKREDVFALVDEMPPLDLVDVKNGCRSLKPAMRLKSGEEDHAAVIAPVIVDVRREALDQTPRFTVKWWWSIDPISVVCEVIVTVLESGMTVDVSGGKKAMEWRYDGVPCSYPSRRISWAKGDWKEFPHLTWRFGTDEDWRQCILEHDTCSFRSTDRD